jgi:hypothetical protein
MDTNSHALMALAQDRLDRARADAPRRRLLRRADTVPART